MSAAGSAERERSGSRRYEMLEKLGAGTYGMVYKAREVATGAIVAIKRIIPDKNDQGIPSTTLREVSALRSVQHENIVRLLDVHFASDNLELVFEYVEQDLYKYLKAFPHGLPPAEVRLIIRQLVEAIAYLHGKGYVHRDLKPQNILIGRRGEVKIADFGLSRAFTFPVRQYTPSVITWWYRPPELLLGTSYYDSKVDVWSLGCILAELANGRPLMPGDSEPDQLQRICKTLGMISEADWPDVVSLKQYASLAPIERQLADRRAPPPLKVLVKALSPAGIDMLARMLTYDPARRASAVSLLADPYFAERS